MIYITGDCHAEFGKFATDAFPEQSNLTRNDYVIICGDFGIWHDTPSERWWLKWLSKKPYTTLFVDGNHENFDRLNGQEFPIVKFHGGKAHKIRPNVFHLMRGFVYDLDGKKVFAFGGASSHDISDGILDAKDFSSKSELSKAYQKAVRENKMVRINHYSWWKEELPSDKEMDFARKSLKKVDNKVDLVITHCCPNRIANMLVYDNKPDILTDFLSEISETVDFNHWYFGHYHTNGAIGEKFTVLYDDIIEEKTSSE